MWAFLTVGRGHAFCYNGGNFLSYKMEAGHDEDAVTHTEQLTHIFTFFKNKLLKYVSVTYT